MKRIYGIILCVYMVLGILPSVTVSAAEATLTILTEPKWESHGVFTEDVVLVVEKGKYGYVDLEGNYVIPPTYSKRDYNLVSFSEGFSAVQNRNNRMIGFFIDKQNKKHFDFGNVAPVLFKDGLAVGMRYNPNDIIIFDKNGEILERQGDPGEVLWFESVCGDGLYGFSKTGMIGYRASTVFGYMDKYQNVVIEPQFEGVQVFCNGIAPVKRNGRWGAINTSGEFIIQPQFEELLWGKSSLTSFCGGIFAAKKNGKWGVVNETGETVIDFIWDEPFTLSDDMNAVYKDGLYGYIDKNGRIVIEPQYEDANAFVNGAALVRRGGAYMLINTTGKQIGTETWDFEAAKYSVPYPEMLFYKKNDMWGLLKLKAPPITANPISSAVIVNGKSVTFNAYEIEGNNYFKLRDLAYVLNGTKKQFEVTWDGDSNAISLTSGQPYTAAGGEMSGKGVNIKFPTLTVSKIMLNGSLVNFTAYTIDGNNYFKLRGLGEAFDFGVVWDGTGNSVRIDTHTEYTTE